MAEEAGYEELYGETLEGYRKYTALSLIVEAEDFERFAEGNTHAANLGSARGEHSSSDSINQMGITKAGDSHLRLLLVEAAEAYEKAQLAINRKS